MITSRGSLDHREVRNAFWADRLAPLDLPGLEPGAMRWGDGFEIETVINTRFAAGGAVIAEVPSTELLRRHGTSNLRTFRDGLRVLRTLLTERRRLVPALVVPAPAEDLALAA